ncbi:phage major capsid protein [Iodobacter sp. CM08]|uniref:phage major capsid protein n=1 Tax=Iodobacter sp. CM08 TaxID=3085902 RepID=UPI0029817D6F|nr:phage major capsid protein [Iodobacter sp. CM08]MDW5417738.1 phage major capsid protein [Iodobacter sp. CM08]
MDKKLQERRAALAKQMRELHMLAEKESRGFSSDEDSAWSKMEADLDDLDKQIKRSGKLHTLDLDLGSSAGVRSLQSADDVAPNDEEFSHSAIFRSFLTSGIAGMSQQEQLIARKHMDQSKELRAFAAGSAGAGGVTVPPDFLAKLEIALKAFGGILNVADVMRTDTGVTLPMPTFNYANVVATIIGEGQTSNTDSSTPFGVANIGAFTYRTPVLPVSYEFLQDSAFGEQYIVDALAGSIARGYNAHATTGDGVGKPRGILLDAAAGKVGSTGQTNVITYDDVIDLIHSVDPAYRVGSKFMLHDSSLKVLRKLKDTTGRPIWTPGYESGITGLAPDTLCGYAYEVNQDMPVMAANAKSIIFGALNKYKARIVRETSVLRLTERYAENLQVAFLLFARMDGRLLDVGANPVKYYANSAT